MFTGIIEDVAEVVSLKKEDGNLHISFKSRIKNELKIDRPNLWGFCLKILAAIFSSLSLSGGGCTHYAVVYARHRTFP